MLCPYCLANVQFALQEGYSCPDCNEQVPAMYVRGYDRYPPLIASAIGLRGHGKTIYFASLFYTLYESPLSAFWQPNFFALSLSDQDLETVHNNARMLKERKLPGSTPMNFPRPTLLRVAGIPMWEERRDCTLVFYDTSGEAFVRASEMVKYARFAQHAEMVLLLISLSDMQDPAHEMRTLLNTYVIGMEDLGGNTREQDLMVVYTKGDEIIDRLSPPTWNDGRTYLVSGPVDSLAQVRGYRRRMGEISTLLYNYTRTELKANEFVNLAQSNFRGVGFSIVSALGSAPRDGQMPVEVNPLRVLDPMIWMIARAPSLSRHRSRRTRDSRWMSVAFFGGVIYGAVGGILGSIIGEPQHAAVWAPLLGAFFGVVGGFSACQFARNRKVLFQPARWASAPWQRLLGSAGIGGAMGGLVGFVGALLASRLAAP
jgi:hypothetical protein